MAREQDSELEPHLNSRKKPIIIAVIGGANPSMQAIELAREVGAELAKNEAVVVCGGLTGVMEAVCRGAKSEGGTTIGILPGNDSENSNPYVDIPIITGMGYARNVIVVKSGRAVIAIDGAYGTLSEIGHALGDNIPVIGLETWELPVRSDLGIHITPANSPKDAVRRALEAVSNKEEGTRGASRR